jgi:hypothetical protein
MAKRIMTPEFRLSFPKLFKAEKVNDGKPKFSVTMLFPKDTDLSEMKKAAMEVGVAKWGEGKLKGKNVPFKDGNKRDYEEYQGMVEVRASRNADFGPPVIVDAERQEILNPAEIYSGCWCRAQIEPYVYDMELNKGVAFGLTAIQKLRDDQPMGGGPSKQETIDAFGDDTDKTVSVNNMFD